MRIEIDMNAVNQDTLVDFCNNLQELTGCHIEIKELYILEVDDPKVAAVLQTLCGGNNHRPVETGMKTKKEKHGKASRQKIYYTIIDGPRAGQKLIGTSIAKVIKAGNLSVGTKVNHPKKGMLQVVGVMPDLYLASISSSSKENENAETA